MLIPQRFFLVPTRTVTPYLRFWPKDPWFSLFNKRASLGRPWHKQGSESQISRYNVRSRLCTAELDGPVDTKSCNTEKVLFTVAVLKLYSITLQLHVSNSDLNAGRSWNVVTWGISSCGNSRNIWINKMFGSYDSIILSPLFT
jgi:hypothetical protein